MLTVTFTPCNGSDQKWTSQHRTDDRDEAMQRALQKHWGKSAEFFHDAGLVNTGTFGQVVKYTGKGSYTSVTSRLRVRIE